MHLCIDCICIHAYSLSQASQQGGGGGKDAAKESDKDGTQHRQGRHRSDGRDARQHRQGCGRSLVSTLQKQAAMKRPNNGSEGDRCRKNILGKVRTAPVAPKDRIWTALLKSPGDRTFWNAYLSKHL